MCGVPGNPITKFATENVIVTGLERNVVPLVTAIDSPFGPVVLAGGLAGVSLPEPLLLHAATVSVAIMKQAHSTYAPPFRESNLFMIS